MKAIVITRPGEPEVLAPAEVADPDCGPDEVLVRNHATALNRADLLQRRGRYPAPPDVPADIPGLEFAGVVERCGARVRGLLPGDRVMGLLGGGGYAERVAVHERICLRIPPALPFEDAAAVPEAFLTAYDALFDRGLLRAGETVLVHAAGSGVGSAAVQLALAAGARPIAMSRTAEKRERLADMGVRHVLDPDAPDLADALARVTGGAGIDVVLDTIGGPVLTMNLALLKPCGRLVVLGLLGGARAELDLSVVLRKRLTVVGTVLRSRPIEEKLTLVGAFANRMLPLFADGSLRPQVDRVMPLDAAAEAHALMERNANFGKIVLSIAAS